FVPKFNRLVWMNNLADWHKAKPAACSAEIAKPVEAIQVQICLKGIVKFSFHYKNSSECRLESFLQFAVGVDIPFTRNKLYIVNPVLVTVPSAFVWGGNWPVKINLVRLIDIARNIKNSNTSGIGRNGIDKRRADKHAIDTDDFQQNFIIGSPGRSATCCC